MFFGELAQCVLVHTDGDAFEFTSRGCAFNKPGQLVFAEKPEVTFFVGVVFAAKVEVLCAGNDVAEYVFGYELFAFAV